MPEGDPHRANKEAPLLKEWGCKTKEPVNWILIVFGLLEKEQKQTVAFCLDKFWINDSDFYLIQSD